MKNTQVRGMLLEEVVLYLLRRSGYATVESAGSDPSLATGPSGLEVLGRGERHQIDAVADFLIPPPFGYPGRLLVEAKFYSSRIGIDVVRNAVGVLKDVSEFFVPSREADPAVRRYHYQSVVVSATDFTAPAQRYAFAQDIDLVPLCSSTFFRPILTKIEAVDVENVGPLPRNDEVALSEMRRAVRRNLEGDDLDLVSNLSEVVREARAIDSSFLAVAGKRQRLFLVPARGLVLSRLADVEHVRIFWNDSGWFIRRSDGEDLFSFDLPQEVFKLYSEEDRLSPIRALQLKSDFFNEIVVYLTEEDWFRIVRLRLDQPWLEVVRRRIDS